MSTGGKGGQSVFRYTPVFQTLTPVLFLMMGLFGLRILSIFLKRAG